MKKNMILITLISILFGSTLLAQDGDPREQVSFGIKAGFNYSNVWDENGQDFSADSKLGLAGGLFLGIPMGEFLGFQPEILISQKGLQATGQLLGTNYSFTRTTTYLDIPLQLQFKPIEYLTILAGPQYSYLISEKNTFTFGDNSTDQEQEFNNDNIRKNILGFVVGADVNIQHLVVSARAGWDFQNNHGDGTSTTPRYKNRWLQLTLGYKF